MSRLCPGKKDFVSVKVKVKEFFERDDLSRLRPGKKDFVSIKLEDGRKEKVQKKLLLSNFTNIL